MRAAATPASNGLVINIGTGVETSVNELYNAIAEAAGIDAPATHGEARHGEMQRSALSAALAGEVLGWSADTDLLTGAAATLDWFRTKQG